MRFINNQISWNDAYEKLIRKYNKYVTQPEVFPYLTITIKMQEAENLIDMYKNGVRTKKLYMKMIQYK